MTADPQPTPPSGPFVRPVERYGRPSRPLPKGVVAGLLAAALLAVVPLTVAVYDRMNPPVRADVLGWEISPQEVTVRVRVEKPRDEAAACVLEASDVRDELVGSRRLELPPGDDVVVVEETFPTAREAVTVEALRCETA